MQYSIKIFFLFAITNALHLRRDQLQFAESYETIKQALIQGKVVTASFFYNDCIPSLGNAVGSLSLQNFEIFDEPTIFGQENIKFSQTSLITNYQGTGFAYDYVRGTLYRNGTVMMYASDFDPVSFKKFYDEEMMCDMDNGSARFRISNPNIDQSSKKLTDYEDIKFAFQNAIPLRLVMEFQGCTEYVGPFGQNAPNCVQGWDIDASEMFMDERFSKEEFVAFSKYGLIRNFMKAQSDGFMYNLGEVKIFKNNTAYLRVHGLDAQNFSHWFNETMWCKVSSEDGGPINLFINE